MPNFFKLTYFKRHLMLPIAVLTLAICFCRVCDAVNECSDASWQLYKSEFNKQYRSMAEEAHRRQVFCNNIHMIYAHNERYKRGEVTFQMGVNQFADLSTDEFRHWLHGGSVGVGWVLA